MRKLRFLLLMVLASSAVSGWAQDADKATASAPGTTALEPLSAGYLTQLVLSLAFVVLCIFALAWLLRRGRFGTAANAGVIQIVAAQALGPRERVVLLQVGEEQVLIGLVPGQISKLHSLKQPLSTAKNEPEAVSSGFAKRLQQVLDSSR